VWVCVCVYDHLWLVAIENLNTIYKEAETKHKCEYDDGTMLSVKFAIAIA